MVQIVSLDAKKESILSLDLFSSYRISHIEDIDSDGIVEIIVSTKYGLRVYKLSDGSIKWRFDLIEGELLSLNLRDINLDGKTEILLLVESGGSRWVYILDVDGNLLSSIEIGDKGFTLGNLKSIKIDNQRILLLLSSANELAISTLEGVTIWRLDARILHYTIGDFNRDGKDELLIIYRKGDMINGALIDLIDFEPIWTTDMGVTLERDPYVEEKKTGRDSLLLIFFSDKLSIYRASNGEKITERGTDVLEIFSGIADVDGDGEKELILTGVNEFDFQTTVEIIWPQDGRGIRYNIPIMINDVRTGDYDGDGREEITLIGFNEVIFLGLEGEKWAIENIFNSEIYASHGEDFDRDGVPEILIIGEKGVAIIDLMDRAILWMDNDLVLHEIDYLLGIGDILPIDIDGDGEDEWLLVDDSSENKTKILLIKGIYGSIKELWSREIRVDYIKDIEIIYPNGLILLVAKNELIALSSDGDIVWRCDNCPSDYLLFADTTGDGAIEVIVFQRKTGIKVISSKDGSIIWEYKGEIMGAYLGDINSDGRYEIVVNRPDAIQILDGSNGSSIYTLLIESKFKRVDVFDVDTDDMDEIIIYKRTGLLLIKDCNVKWELDFLDPTKIRKIKGIRFASRSNLNILALSGKTLFVIDPFKAPIIDKFEIDKYIQHYIVADINGNGRDEIILISKNKKEITIIGNEGYKHVEIPVGRNYKLKTIPTKKRDFILLVSNKSLWLLNPRTYKFEVFLELNEKIIDVAKISKSLFLMTNRTGSKLEKEFKIYKLFLSGESNPKIIGMELISAFENSTLSELVNNSGKNSLELLYASNSKVIIMDWKHMRLLSLMTKSGFGSVIKVDNVVLSKGYHLTKGTIFTWKDNILHILDPHHNENVSLKIPNNIVHVAVGDIDGDRREEVIILTDKYELILVDPLLYKLGCKKIYSLGFVEPILLTDLMDIDSDGVQELVFVKNRGLEVIKLNIFNKTLLDKNKETYDSVDLLLKVKIKTLCDKDINKIQAKIEMLKTKSKVGSWNPFSSVKDTNLEEK